VKYNTGFTELQGKDWFTGALALVDRKLPAGKTKFEKIKSKKEHGKVHRPQG
jgi:hypothetical protein